MQPRLLLTPSLYDSWRFFHLLESKPKQELLDTLLKIKTPPNDKMLAGIDFENAVRDYCEGRLTDLGMFDGTYADCVREVAGEVKGGLWQQSMQINMVIAGNPYLVYGKSDVMRRDWVKDIKFSSSYEVGKYTPSIQHAVYLVGSGIKKFRYLISDGRSVWMEDYFWEPDMEQLLRGKLATMVESLMADVEFRKAFLKNWKTKYDN